jgi:hypothetical protein
VESYKSSSTLWQECKGVEHINLLECKAWRVVEDQSRSSTRELVNTLEEHEILEDLIETRSKPILPHEPEFLGLHFLLATPFRYPPLRYGSRFGRRFERSLWYGAKELETALGESAFYRFLFFSGTEAKILPCRTSHSVYAINILTHQGVILEHDPFKKYSAFISQKDTYHHSQPLGSAMRDLGVQGFSYFSARLGGKINIGVFSPRAFTSKSVDFIQHWKCYTDHQNVEFTRDHLAHKKINFHRENFLVNNVLPFNLGN